MDTTQSFQQFLATRSVEVSLAEFVVDLLLAATLSFILRSVYIKYGDSLSNRRTFARTFMLTTMTTMLVITIVKSSLALSLGLVGALSIVRFRAAIKEPGELAYLFLAIGIGLGLGAAQRVITLVAFAIIVAFIWASHCWRRSEESQNLYLTVSSHNPKKAELKQVVEVLKAHCAAVNLRRFDDTREQLEATFQAEFGSFRELEAASAELQGLGDQVTVSFLDNNGIGGVG